MQQFLTYPDPKLKYVIKDTWMSKEVSKRLGSVGYNPNISHLSVGYNPLILTIDPNFQRDIQACLNLRFVKYMLCVCVFSTLDPAATGRYDLDPQGILQLNSDQNLEELCGTNGTKYFPVISGL